MKVNRTKILYVVSTLCKSGPTVVLSNIIKYLDRNKFDPVVLTLSPEPNDTSISYVSDSLKVKVVSLGLSRTRGVFAAASGVKRYVDDNGITIVHSHGVRADWVVRNIERPRVCTLHNYPYYDYSMLYGKLAGNIIASLHLRCLKKMGHPVVVSQAVSEMLRERNNYEIDVVRNGVDVATFLCLEKHIVRKRLKIDNHLTVFISVGSLSKRKDPMTVIASFQKAYLPGAILIVLGEGECRGLCESMANGSPNIRFMGNVDNVDEYLCASDYFVSASLAEGLPNSVMEAMACGLPCILSDIPPHREIHDIDADSSLSFKVEDRDDLAAKLSGIVEMNWQKMHDASINISHNHLSAQIMSKKYQDVYELLLNENRR